MFVSHMCVCFFKLCNFHVQIASRNIIEATICFLFTSHSEYRSRAVFASDKYTVNYKRNSRFPPKDFGSKYDATDVIRPCDISVLIANPLVRRKRWPIMRIFYSYFIKSRANSRKRYILFS